ncbi:hypothetical protein [Pedobacter aquatilis]|uniref:hypothetical protein n=1 Tax=Pedobacter aquatilis TaxID=351343 RepID=UPI00292CBC5A|nr:hypothetical protein [Pedobacter aquatilis]
MIGINPQKGAPFEKDVLKIIGEGMASTDGDFRLSIIGIDLPTYMDMIIKNLLSNN